MTALIVILICLGLQRYLGIHISLADFDWFKPYHGLLKSTLAKSDLFKGYVGIAVVVLPLMLVVALVDYLLNDWIFSVLDLAFGVLVLMYCMDARDLKQRLSGYLGGEEGKKADADKQVSEFLNGNVPSADQEKARGVTTAIFTQSLHQVFSVLFWYLILGTSGAVLYFAVTLISQNESEFSEMQQANAMVLGVLDWVPVRLLGLSFALVGSFGSVFAAWVKALAAGIERSNEFATEFGLAAMGIDIQSGSANSSVDECSNAADLVFRTQVIWVVVIAVLVLVRFVR